MQQRSVNKWAIMATVILKNPKLTSTMRHEFGITPSKASRHLEFLKPICGVSQAHTGVKCLKISQPHKYLSDLDLDLSILLWEVSHQKLACQAMLLCCRCNKLARNIHILGQSPPRVVILPHGTRFYPRDFLLFWDYHFYKSEFLKLGRIYFYWSWHLFLALTLLTYYSS